MPCSVATGLVLRTKVAFNKSEVYGIVSWNRVFGNFPLSLAAQISIAELSLEFST